MPGGNKLYGGTLNDFDVADNMAKEIENAFAFIRSQLPPIGGGITQPLPSGVNAQDMRLLFIAIARGVINHLQNNPGAFAVQVHHGNFISTGNVNSVSVGP